jgi:hypothetical protein
VRRAGYKSIKSGLRRLTDLCKGIGPETRFLVDGLPAAVDVPATTVQEAMEATEIAEAEGIDAMCDPCLETAHVRGLGG